MKHNTKSSNHIARILTALAVMALLVSCFDSDEHYSIVVVNTSDKDIIVAQCGGELTTRYVYQGVYGRVFVAAKSSKELITGPISWEDQIASCRGKASFFVLDNDSCGVVFNDSTINWKPMNDREVNERDSIIDSRVTIARYLYSVSDLERMNWTIVYPEL